MNGLAVVEALWRCTGITGIIKHAMGASYEESTLHVSDNVSNAGAIKSSS